MSDAGLDAEFDEDAVVGADAGVDDELEVELDDKAD